MGEVRFQHVARPDRRTARWGHPLAHIVQALPRAIEGVLASVDLPPGARVLDYGCAEQPYRHLFGPGVEYLGADLPGNPLADLAIEPGRPLDLPDRSVALVLSSQVLEHVADPRAYLRECRRTLEPGGTLVLSTHGLMPLHRDPVDYWRWTCDGLVHAVSEAGFEVDTFEGVMGMAATGIQLFQDATILRLPRRTRRVYAALLQALAGVADRWTSAEARSQDAMVFLLSATPREP